MKKCINHLYQNNVCIKCDKPKMKKPYEIECTLKSCIDPSVLGKCSLSCLDRLKIDNYYYVEPQLTTLGLKYPIKKI